MSHQQLKKRTIYKSIPVLQIDQKTLSSQGNENKYVKSVKSKEIQTPLFSRAFTPRIACKKSITHRRVGSDYNNTQTASSRVKALLPASTHIQRIASATTLFTHQRSVSNVAMKEPRIVYIKARKSSEGTYPKPKRNLLGEPEVKFRKSSSEQFNDIWKYFEKKVTLRIGEGVTKFKAEQSLRKASSVLEDLNISPVKHKTHNFISEKSEARGQLQTIVSPINATADSCETNDSLMSMIKELDKVL